MSIRLDKKTTKEQLDKALLKLRTGKTFSSKKHLGKVKWGEDGVEFQRKLRDEWD